VQLDAYPASNVGITAVRIQRSAAGSTTSWTDVCTTGAAPHTCTWDSTTVANGSYSFRAILTDGSGATTTSAIVGPRAVDNSAVRGVDVQTVSAGTRGRVETGDAVVLTYSQVMRPTSLLAGWDGTARQVVVRIRDGALLGRGSSGDTLDVSTTTGFGTPVNLGSVHLGADVVANNTVAFTATMTAGTVTVAGAQATTVTLVLGSQVVGGVGLVRTTATAGTMVWTPSTTALSAGGVPSSAAPATETGAPDVDF
jgi:hypothetical protein